MLQIEKGEPFSVLYLGLAHLNKGNIKKTINIWQGYRNKKQPLVEEEIKRQLTLLQIAECQRYAQKAMAQEKQLQTIEPKANTIAVSYYKDLSPDKSMGAFQKGLAAMITTDLSKINSLKVVERLRLQSLLEEMQLGQTGIVDEKTAPRVGRLLGAKNFLVGSLRRGSLSVLTSINGMAGSVTVPLNEFFKIPPAAVLTAANALKVKLTSEEEAAIGAVHTKSLEAFVFYGQALMARDAGQWKKAKDLFDKALKADPLFDLAQIGAAGCPGATSASLSDLSNMTFAQMANTAESSISDSQADQGSTDSSADDGAGGGGGGGGGSCFAYNTNVVMADGSLKRIIDVQVGDRVMAFVEQTGKMISRQVTAKYRGDADHYYFINGALKVVPPHPFLKTNGEWVAIGELKIGDKLKGIDGVAEIKSIEKIKFDHRIYNIHVEDSHNFFVTAFGKDYYLVDEGSYQIAERYVK